MDVPLQKNILISNNIEIKTFATKENTPGVSASLFERIYFNIKEFFQAIATFFKKKLGWNEEHEVVVIDIDTPSEEPVHQTAIKVEECNPINNPPIVISVQTEEKSLWQRVISEKKVALAALATVATIAAGVAYFIYKASETTANVGIDSLLPQPNFQPICTFANNTETFTQQPTFLVDGASKLLESAFQMLSLDKAADASLIFYDGIASNVADLVTNTIELTEAMTITMRENAPQLVSINQAAVSGNLVSPMSIAYGIGSYLRSAVSLKSAPYLPIIGATIASFWKIRSVSSDNESLLVKDVELENNQERALKTYQKADRKYQSLFERLKSTRKQCRYATAEVDEVLKEYNDLRRNFYTIYERLDRAYQSAAECAVDPSKSNRNQLKTFKMSIQENKTKLNTNLNRLFELNKRISSKEWFEQQRKNNKIEQLSIAQERVRKIYDRALTTFNEDQERIKELLVKYDHNSKLSDTLQRYREYKESFQGVFNKLLEQSNSAYLNILADLDFDAEEVNRNIGTFVRKLQDIQAKLDALSEQTNSTDWLEQIQHDEVEEKFTSIEAMIEMIENTPSMVTEFKEEIETFIYDLWNKQKTVDRFPEEKLTGLVERFQALVKGYITPAELDNFELKNPEIERQNKVLDELEGILNFIQEISTNRFAVKSYIDKFNIIIDSEWSAIEGENDEEIVNRLQTIIRSFISITRVPEDQDFSTSSKSNEGINIDELKKTISNAAISRHGILKLPELSSDISGGDIKLKVDLEKVLSGEVEDLVDLDRAKMEYHEAQFENYRINSARTASEEHNNRAIWSGYLADLILALRASKAHRDIDRISYCGAVFEAQINAQNDLELDIWASSAMDELIQHCAMLASIDEEIETKTRKLKIVGQQLIGSAEDSNLQSKSAKLKQELLALNQDKQQHQSNLNVCKRSILEKVKPLKIQKIDFSNVSRVEVRDFDASESLIKKVKSKVVDQNFSFADDEHIVPERDVKEDEFESLVQNNLSKNKDSERSNICSALVGSLFRGDGNLSIKAMQDIRVFMNDVNNSCLKIDMERVLESIKDKVEEVIALEFDLSDILSHRGPIDKQLRNLEPHYQSTCLQLRDLQLELLEALTEEEQEAVLEVSNLLRQYPSHLQQVRHYLRYQNLESIKGLSDTQINLINDSIDTLHQNEKLVELVHELQQQKQLKDRLLKEKSQFSEKQTEINMQLIEQRKELTILKRQLASLALKADGESLTYLSELDYFMQIENNDLQINKDGDLTLKNYMEGLDDLL